MAENMVSIPGEIAFFFFEFTEFKVALHGSTVQCIFRAHAKCLM